MVRFKSVGQAQSFLVAHDQIVSVFSPNRKALSLDHSATAEPMHFRSERTTPPIWSIDPSGPSQVAPHPLHLTASLEYFERPISEQYA